ncbi:hypothetical protein PybrP1_009782 [[Pythium] brassicae (nom. inval.)]|nr:hypothetical protein PybrP1_009782 [[Pythium] brassicae (nom. inval.)]
MTTAAMFLETVSLNDDAPASGGRMNVPDVDSLEGQQRFPHDVKFAKHSTAAAASNPIGDDSDDDAAHRDHVVVVVDAPPKQLQQTPPRGGATGRPVLPPLRVPPRDDAEEYLRDYVDPTLFSPEVSRRAVEIARSRAKTLEMELKELALLEDDTVAAASVGPGGAKLSPAEAVGIISSAFLASLSRVKQLVAAGGAKEYDLLSGSSPSSKADDDLLDTDGDGLQISPDGSQGGHGKHFQAPKHRPALKRVSAYSSLEKKASVASISATARSPAKKRIVWHEDVLDQDEEFYEDDAGEPLAAPSPTAAGETEALMEGSPGGTPASILHYKNDRLTPRSKKKRKKLVKGMMRRLTPTEKEALYKQRPDLMIVPNWAQKYRQGLEDDESSRWSAWLVAIIGTLAALLVVLIILIARERAGAADRP